MHFSMRFPLKNRALAGSLLVAVAACNLWAAREPSTPTKPDATGGGFHVDVRGSVYYLASDDLEGRGIGTHGLDLAADFIADNFRKLGLKPAPGQEGYFQPFKMTTSVRPAEATALRLVSGDGKGNGDARAAYVMNEDYVPLSFSAEKAFEGPLVFVGYGITDANRSYNDYDGVDVKGKVALALRYEPHDGEGHSRFSDDKDRFSPAARLGAKAKAAADAGAVALVLVNPPTFHEEDDPLVPVPTTFGGDHSEIPFVQVRRRVVDAWLKQAGVKETLKELQERIDDVGKPHSLALPETVKVAGNVAIERVQREVKNVMAVLPGSGALKDEYVVIGAHYDHLGHGGEGSLRPRSHDIHNGADDNASGTSAMLELAEHFSKAGSFGRSILFVAFTGEESGLVGSNHLVNHPPVPPEKMAYMLNLDMVGRVRNEIIYVGGMGTAPSFDKLLAEADEASPLQVKSFGRGGFGPSDHMSFAKKRVPVLFFYSGNHPDYHTPTDDADKVNYKGIEEVVGLAANVAQKMLVLPREQYVEAADAHSMFGGAPGSGSGGGFKASLGVVPDYNAEEIKGCRITGTSPGSPAAKAGLLDGDVLVQWNAHKIDSVFDLTDELRNAKPGNKVKLGVLRDGKRIEIEATLAEPKH